MNFIAIQGAFDRAYSALLGLRKRFASTTPARVAQRGRPHSYTDATKEELLFFQELLADLVEQCPIVPFQQAERRASMLEARLLELDLAVQDPFEYRNRYRAILAEIDGIRSEMDANGIGIRHVPWYRFWQRWLGSR